MLNDGVKQETAVDIQNKHSKKLIEIDSYCHFNGVFRIRIQYWTSVTCISVKCM